MNPTTTDRDRGDDRQQARRDALALTLCGPLVAFLLVAVWALAGAGYFWPAWPLLGMSIAMLVGLWRAFGPLPQAGAIESRRPRPR